MTLVAVVSDVHGSLTALEAVVEDLAARSPDVVLHGGDLVLMGPQPAEVVDRIRDLGWRGVVGNTDELLWRPDVREHQIERAPKLRALIELLFDEYRPWTAELLGPDRVAWLRTLPAELEVEGLRLLHASPGDLWLAPQPDAPADELQRVYGGSGHDVVAYGHIHRPYSRQVAELVVTNSGSVGMPFDGDPRAAYVLIEDGEPRVVRVDYDVERDIAALERVRHPDAPRLAEIRRRGRFVAPGG